MTYWHIILTLPKIGLMKEGLQYEVARELKEAVIKQLGDMTTERFLTYCIADRRRILPYNVDKGILGKPRKEFESNFRIARG